MDNESNGQFNGNDNGQQQQMGDNNYSNNGNYGNYNNGSYNNGSYNNGSYNNGGYNNGGYDNNYNNYNPYQPQNNGQQKDGSPLGIASMVLGIISLVFSCCCYPMSIVLGIAAIVLGIVGIKKENNGKGFAIAGIITGAIGVFFAIVLFIFEIYMRQTGMYQKIMDMYLDHDSSSELWKSFR